MLLRPSADLASRMSIDRVDMNKAGLEEATCRTASLAAAADELVLLLFELTPESRSVARWNNWRRSSMGSTKVCQVVNPFAHNSIASGMCGLDKSCRYSRSESAAALSALKGLARL